MKGLITFKDIKEFKSNLRIGQRVTVIEKDPVWEGIKHKIKGVIYEKHRHVFCVKYIESGIIESFTYVQTMMGEGPWLV